MKFKYLFFYIILISIILFTGCSSDKEYYSIEKVDVDEEQLYIFDNDDLIISSKDKTDFYINNYMTIKQLLEFDNTDEEYKVELIEEINLNASLYGTDLSNYSLKNIKTGETVLFKNLSKHKPCLIIKLSAFCEACNGFNFEWLKKVEEANYNYILLAENIDEQEQYNYIVERGGASEKIYISDGCLDGSDVLIGLGTPNLVFVSNDNKIRIISEFFMLDGDAMVSYLNLINQDY